VFIRNSVQSSNSWRCYKIHERYLFQPPVTGFEDYKNWGEINGIRYPINNGNFLVKKGRMFKDVIL